MTSSSSHTPVPPVTTTASSVLSESKPQASTAGQNSTSLNKVIVNSQSGKRSNDQLPSKVQCPKSTTVSRPAQSRAPTNELQQKLNRRLSSITDADVTEQIPKGMLGSEEKGTGVKTRGSNSVQVCVMVHIAHECTM